MQIIGPTEKGREDEVRIDVSRGAVIFNPWPFAKPEVCLSKGAWVVGEDGVWTLGTSRYISEEWNTLCTLTNGETAVTKRKHWHAAVKVAS